MALKHSSPIELRLTVGPQAVSCFYPLLSSGFMIRVQVGCSIHDLLRDQLGIDGKLVETHIQTVFLNGKAVDDLHQSIIEDGCVLSLSGALPGMVGAAFRKSGFYAGFREAVSFRNNKAPVSGPRPGSLRVKLFNLTGPMIGPFFLRHGIEIAGAELEEVFQTCADTLSDGLRSVKINGRESTSKGLRALDLKHRSIRLFVEASMD